MLLLLIQFTRLAVYYAKRSQRESIFTSQRCAGIKPDARFAHDQGIFPKPWILQSVLNDKQIVLLDRVRTDRNLPWGLLNLYANLALEPLPVFVHQRKHGHRRSTHVGRKNHKIVETLFGFGVED